MFASYVNVWAVLVSAVVSMVIGYFWYGPLFGKRWMSLQGFTQEDTSGAGKAMIIAFISALFTAYFLARVLDFIGAGSAWKGIWNAFWIWFGFLATFEALKLGFEKRKFALYAIEMGYQLVWFLIAGLIIGIWR